MFYKNIYATCTCSDTFVLLFADCLLLLPPCILVPLLHNFLPGHIFSVLSFDGGGIGGIQPRESLPLYSQGLSINCNCVAVLDLEVQSVLTFHIEETGTR